MTRRNLKIIKLLIKSLNQKKIKKRKKEKSKERKAYENEMDKVKSNDLNRFLDNLFINLLLK